MSMFTRAFWMDILVRAVKTLCQSAVAALVAAGTGLIDTNYVGLLSVAGMAALISILTNVGGASDAGRAAVLKAGQEQP